MAEWIKLTVQIFIFLAVIFGSIGLIMAFTYYVAQWAAIPLFLLWASGVIAAGVIILND